MNAFLKGGFLKSTDEGSSESQSDKTKEEDFIRNIEFDHSEIDGHEYVECHKDVVTSGIHTISDLIPCYDRGDDEDD